MGQREALRTELWRLADRVRGTVDGRTPYDVARVAVVEGLAPTWREQAVLAQELRIAEAADPEVVADFLLAFTAGLPPQRALDPWAGFGISLAALDDASRLRASVAMEINPDIHDAIRYMRSTRNVEWLLGDASALLEQPCEPFDLVIGSPPVNLPRVAARIGPAQLPVRISQTFVMVAQAAVRLTPNGTMAVVVAESLFSRLGEEIRKILSTLGVHPSAALALPRRGFGQSVSMSLAVFDRVVHEDLFVGAIQGTADLDALVANLRARRPGRLPALGRIVDPDSFRSWRAIELEEETRRQARTSGLRPVPFSEICMAIRTPQRDAENPFTPEPNAVYLPSLGTSPAVTSLDDLRIRPQNYLQLVVNDSVADPEYLASFLNTPLGRRVRELMLSGTTIPRIVRQSLLDASAYLPPTREHQRRATDVDRRLRDLEQSFDRLRRKLWEEPLHAREVESELRLLVEGDGLDRWRDNLPFPLASVLWRYDAEEGAEARCRYLIHFFEALTLLLVDLHLSALRQEAEVLADARRTGGTGAAYAHGSIGIWCDLLGRLAKRTRGLIGGDASLARELFRVADLERLERISSTALVAALRDEAAEYRNTWIGHGAPVRPDEWERRTEAATSTLDRVRAALDDAFVGWQLVRAGQGGNRGGVITLSLERLTGPQRAFRRARVQLREWPEEGCLYMLDEGAEAALRLSPLFALKRGPASAEDACYFFDRMDGDRVRWVSYHFEGQPEVVDSDPEVGGLIAELNALG